MKISWTRSFPRLRAIVGLTLAMLALGLPASARAEVHGGIEIGAKGVKAAVLDVKPAADGFEVKIVMSGNQNTTLTAGLAASEKFADPALKDTATAVARFAARMRKEHRVPDARIHVVGSSGLFSAIAGKNDAIKANQEALAKAIREACELPIGFINVQREIELSIAGIVPPRLSGTSLVLDIGSGNTKGGYRDADKKLVSVSIPFGSVTFTDLVTKRGGKERFAETATALRGEVLLPGLKKSLESKPGLRKRDRIYLSGGAVWAMATLVRPANRGGYVALTAEDIRAYRALLRKSPEVFPEIDLSAIADASVRAAATKEIARVKAVFKPRQLLAGAEILNALSSAFEFGQETKLYFVRHAQVGWIVAYVAEKAAPSR